ncbi:MAG: MaoC/PaaZ C-terminal domain-containing protein [Pseudomonadota bacterium]|nr:MaoC/PaaZ C-terminal domain-containing protein [Pseudomonadota bacterium]
MTIDYKHLLSLQSTGHTTCYSDRESMLYALSIGMGKDPLASDELDYVFERNPLKTVPTMASVLAPIPLLKDCGYDYTKVLHAEQHLVLHRPLPQDSELIADARVIEAYDKGADKGALIYTETTARTTTDDEPLFTTTSGIFARGDGGFGGVAGPSPTPHPIPDRPADTSCSIETRDDQALLYRLNGDRNPLHADPDLATRVGFPVPILHGLCTYGTACLAVLKTICNYDHTSITGFDVRFSAPVYPGETIITDLWRDGNIVSFECRVKEREVTVIRNGKCTLTGSPTGENQ